jgi:hypothetical protein
LNLGLSFIKKINPALKPGQQPSLACVVRVFITRTAVKYPINRRGSILELRGYSSLGDPFGEGCTDNIFFNEARAKNPPLKAVTLSGTAPTLSLL